MKCVWLALAVLALGCHEPLGPAPTPVPDDAAAAPAQVDADGARDAVQHAACAAPLPAPLPLAPGERAEPSARSFAASDCAEAAPAIPCDRDEACPGPSLCLTLSAEGPGLCAGWTTCETGRALGHHAGACVSCVEPELYRSACCSDLPGLDCRSFPLTSGARGGPGELCSLHPDCAPGLVCGAPSGAPWGEGLGRCLCPGVAPETVADDVDCAVDSSPADWGSQPEPLAASCVPALAEGWVIERVAHEGARSFRAALGPDDTLHVLYAEQALYHVVRGADAWGRRELVPEAGVDIEESAPPTALALALDAQGRVHGLVAGQSSGYAPTYVTNTGGRFRSERVGDDVGATSPALALDGQGAPHLAFVDGGQSNLNYVAPGAQGFLAPVVVDDYAGSVALLFVGDALHWVVSKSGSVMVRRVQGESAVTALGLGLDVRAALAATGELQVVSGQALGAPSRVGLARVLGDEVELSEVYAKQNPRYAELPTTPALALDGAGRVHVAHAAPEGLVLATQTDDGFVPQTLVRDAAAPELLIDSADDVHVFYSVRVQGNWELRHVYRADCDERRRSE